MKAPIITEPVIGYNGAGKRHRATHEALIWISQQIREGNERRFELGRTWQDGGGIIEEMDYRAEEASIETLVQVHRYLNGLID